MSKSFEPRSLINAGMMRQFAGQSVSIMLKVENEVGLNLTGTSTDHQKVRVVLPVTLNARKDNWVEIIGTPVGTDAIRAKEAILFTADDVDFDEDGYNMMVQFMNNCKDIYRQG